MPKRDLKEVLGEVGERARKAGRDVVGAISDEERLETAKQTARDVEHNVEDLLSDLSEEAVRVLQSEEVEQVVDKMGSALKNLARRIRDAREGDGDGEEPA